MLMRSLYQVQVLLKVHGRTEPPVLAYHLVRTAGALPQVIQQTLKDGNHPRDYEIGSLKAVLTMANRSLHALIKGFNRLSHIAEGFEVQGQVTYAYLQMYRKLIDALDDGAESALHNTISSDGFNRDKQAAAFEG